MLNRLWVRLSLAFLLVAWVSIGTLTLVVYQTTEVVFRQYITERDRVTFNPDLIDRLLDYYAANKSWAGAESALTGRGSGGTGQGGGEGRGAQLVVADKSGMVSAASNAELLGTQLGPDDLEAAMPLLLDGTQVGWLLRQTPGAQALGEAEITFLTTVNRWLGLAALGATLLALLIGAAFTWALARPLRLLTRAAHELSRGALGKPVTVRGTVEVNELAGAFNSMSNSLGRAEAQRQRMAADIAHELRTPVSVLRGHLEAMMDGVYPLDSAHLAVAYDQTIHLARLVEDLRLLTQAEAGRLPLHIVPTTPSALVETAVMRFAPLAQDSDIALTHTVEASLPQVNADAVRIQQVLDNLLINALYHTQVGGQIAITAGQAGDRVIFSVCNTGSLPPEHAAHVFERFWRADESRQRDAGGSGLGLAIARQFVLLHDGCIQVEARDGLTCFRFDLPQA